MTSLQYQYVVQNSFSNTFNIRFVIVEILASVRKYFSWTRLKTGIITDVSKDLSSMYITAKGINSITLHFTKEEVNILYPKVAKQIKSYNKFISVLDQFQYFGNADLEIIANDLLLEFYSIDFKLKSIAFADNQAPVEDKELINFSTKLSSQALSSLDGCKV